MDIDELNDTANDNKVKLTFTNTIGQNQMFASPLFSDANQSQNILQNTLNINKISNEGNKYNKDENIISPEVNQNIKKSYSEKKALKSFYVYYALKVIKFYLGLKF